MPLGALVRPRITRKRGCTVPASFPAGEGMYEARPQVGCGRCGIAMLLAANAQSLSPRAETKLIRAARSPEPGGHLGKQLRNTCAARRNHHAPRPSWSGFRAHAANSCQRKEHARQACTSMR